MTRAESTGLVKHGCTDKVPRYRVDNKSGCLCTDELVHIPRIALGHDGLAGSAGLGSAGNAGKLEINWDCGC